MPIRKGNRDRKTGVLACLGKQASSLFLHLSPWEDRRPRLSRQTGFQPVSYIAIHFDISKNRIISDGDGVYINRLSPLKKSPSHSWQDRYHPRLNELSVRRRMRTLLAVAICIVTSGIAVSAPLPPLKEKAIEGTVVGFVWMSEMQHEEDGVWNLGCTSEWAAHYIVLLKAPKLAKKSSEIITSYVRGCVIRHRILDAEIKDGEMLLLLTSKRLKEFKVGAKLNVEGYEMDADEWGTSAIHTKLLIDGKPPTVIAPPYPNRVSKPTGEQDGTGQPATSSETKPEGGEKPQPDSEVAPR